MNGLQPQPVRFTTIDLDRSAKALLQTHPDTVVAYRLWRDVLRLPVDNLALRSSVWVRQLEAAQHADGSWGRFHSQDTQAKTAFRTSEEAIQRALALGLTVDDPPLKRARQYILRALAGEVTISDPPEKNERWPFTARLILAGRLAQLDPANPVLEAEWRSWVDVARRAFASGVYRLEDEAAVYPALAGIQAPQGFLESQYALWILSSRPLPADLDQALVAWIWGKADGIRYVRVPLQCPPPRQMGGWFRSMEILARFATWRQVATPMLNQLWEQRSAQGRWDFGQERDKSVEFPLSDTWRRPGAREVDYSTRVLVLLRQYYA